jgi:hypothetical protein
MIPLPGLNGFLSLGVCDDISVELSGFLLRCLIRKPPLVKHTGSIFFMNWDLAIARAKDGVKVGGKGSVCRNSVMGKHHFE